VAKVLGYAIGLGVSPSEFLRAGRIELEAIMQALPYAQEWQDTRDDNLAVRCVNAYAKAVKR
jgi:hypothetical protein